MYRRTSLAIVAAVGTATLLAGCGSSSSGGSPGTSGSTGTGSNNSSQDPSAELQSAAAALGQASTLTTSIKLGATAGQLSSLASSQGSSISPTEASAIAGAQIAIEVTAPSGKKLDDLTAAGADTSGASIDFTISDNGTPYLSVRSVNKVIYVQLNAKDLLTAIGQGATYQQLSGASASLPPFVAALLQGKWISLPDSAAKSLSGSLGAGASSAPSAATEQKLLAAFKQILSTDVTVTRASSGSSDQLTLSGNSRTIAKDFVNALSAAVPTAGGVLGSTDTSTVPNKTITLGATVTGGALSEVSIDLGQFDTKKKVTLPVEVNFSQSGAAITAPSGAVQVTAQDLSGLLGSAGGLGG